MKVVVSFFLVVCATVCPSTQENLRSSRYAKPAVPRSFGILPGGNVKIIHIPPMNGNQDLSSILGGKRFGSSNDLLDRLKGILGPSGGGGEHGIGYPSGNDGSNLSDILKQLEDQMRQHQKVQKDDPLADILKRLLHNQNGIGSPSGDGGNSLADILAKLKAQTGKGNPGNDGYDPDGVSGSNKILEEIKKLLKGQSTDTSFNPSSGGEPSKTLSPGTCAKLTALVNKACNEETRSTNPEDNSSDYDASTDKYNLSYNNN